MSGLGSEIALAGRVRRAVPVLGAGLAFLLAAAFPAQAAEAAAPVYEVDMTGAIGVATSRHLERTLPLAAAAHAQYEIRVYAEAIAGIVEKWCPIAYEGFRDYRMTGAAVSGPGLAVIRRFLAGEDVTQETSGLGKREWAELMATLGRKE